MRRFNQFFLIMVLSLSGFTLQAQNETDTTDFYSMSLEDLMKIQITVASTEALTTRESPGIVTLITADEIAASGARDLIDLLRMVPGFEFGVDVQGVVGLGLRGNWGHEGKILVLLDGQEMNERSFATTPLGNRFPLDQIDRIEIIRGPGSAMYGGYAELGVINITSKSGKALKGGMVSATYGQMSETFGRREANLMLGNDNDVVGWDAKFSLSDGNRSDQVYTDVYGNSYNMKDNSRLKNIFANAGLQYKNLKVRLMYEDYMIEQRDLFDAIIPEALEMRFKTLHTEIKYDFKPSSKVTITPRFKYKSENPWQANSETAALLDAGDFSGAFSDKTVDQTLAEVVSNMNISEKVNLTGGLQYYSDKGKSVNGYEYRFTSSTGINFYNFSAFAQGLFKLDAANIILGARFNHHEQFGSSFVPRIGFTKVKGKFHGKLLISQAFRAPSIQNIDPNPDIKPEITTVFELEMGYQISKSLLFVANIYNITIIDPIVYFYDTQNNAEVYLNYDKTGTIGAEAEIKYKGSIGTFSLNYSYYSANGKNKVDSYSVPDDDNRLLAFPQGKLNLNGNFKLTKNLSFNPSFTYLGERSGYENEIAITNYDPVLFANVYLTYKNLFNKGIELGCGVFNLTDNDYKYIQPYNSGHAPLPQASREIVVRLKYKFKFN